MITRIVCMTFDPERTGEFLAVFEANKNFIAGFEGCLQLELQRDTAEPNVFFTISRWRSEEDLENYRRSDLFRNTWAQTRILFSAKPRAWSMQSLFNSGKGI